MAQGKGGGQDSSGVDGMGPDAFGGTGGYGGDEGNLSDAHEGQVSSYGGDVMGSGMDGWGGVNPTDDPSGLGYGAYAGQNQTAMDVDYSAYENPGTQFSPMEFGPQHQMGLSTQQMRHNVRVGYGPQRTAQMDDIDAMMEQQERARTMSQLDAMMEQQERARTMSQIDAMMEQQERARTMSQLDAMMEQKGVTTQGIVDDNAAVKNAPTTTPPPPQVSKYDQKQFYSALDDPDASLKSKGLEIQGFLNHISRKNYTDQGFFSKLGLLSSKLNQRQQIEQIENFMAKKGTQLSIEALNQAHSKQINENPGFKAFLPGHSLINGLMSAMGIPSQHTHPDVQALYDKMTQLGMIEKEHGEDIDQASCEAMGYRWDAGLQACFKSDGTLFQGNWSPGSDALSSGSGTNGQKKMLYNVHTGQYDIPPT
jgi:hypothetical protein